MNIIAVSHKGPNKAENEDRVIVGKSILTEGTLHTQLVEGTVAIADGVGGNSAGALASHFVATHLTNYREVSTETLTEMNAKLLAYSSSIPNCENMATTLSGISVCDGITQLFSVGNTRVYSIQGRQYLKQLTTDDTTLNYLLATGQIEEDEAVTFSRKNEITACFGGGKSDLLKLKITVIDSLTVPFLITSDGIHDYLSADQMEEIIGEYGISATACDSMISAARKEGSTDDVSVIFGEL